MNISKNLVGYTTDDAIARHTITHKMRNPYFPYFFYVIENSGQRNRHCSYKIDRLVILVYSEHGHFLPVNSQFLMFHLPECYQNNTWHLLQYSCLLHFEYGNANVARLSNFVLYDA